MDPLETLALGIAASGLIGLLSVTLVERLVPLVPSYVLLVTVGIAAAKGHWSLTMAFWLSTAGSLLGSVFFYGLGFALGEARSFAVLKRSARLLGISEAQLGRLIVSFRRHERTLAFGSQLIPSVRLIAPGIAGLLRTNPRAFLVATTLGVALWNSLFLGLGYAAALVDGGMNASAVAVKIVLILLVGEGVAAGAWRAIVLWRSHTLPAQLATKN